MRLHENSEAFYSLIEETAEQTGLREIYVEKDYWVTRALRYLANSKYIDNAVFKGGTSLSKAHKLIARFSEDIDLAILHNKTNGNSRKKLLKDIENIVSTDLIYLSNDEIESKGSKFRKTVYQYPHLIQDINFGQASTELIIELNSFTTPEPYEKCEIQSIIAETLVSEHRFDLIKQFSLESFNIYVLAVERTLTEKIIRLVKDSYHQDPIKQLSIHIRHLYDLCLILQKTKYREFVASNQFTALLSKCINDEKINGPEAQQSLHLSLIEAPLFKKINDWSKSLTRVYHEDFADFVFGELPTIEQIQETLFFIKEKCIH